jgi:hypothetical protein
MNYRFVTLIMVIILLHGGSTGQDESRFTIGQFKYDSTQAINGQGFSNSYQNLETRYSNIKSTSHGSGVSNSEVISRLRQSAFEPNSTTLKNSSSYKIDLQESSQFVYFEQPFALGRSFRSEPIRSLWEENTWAKNYRDGVSINTLFSNARSLKKDLTIEVLYKDEYRNQYKLKYNGTGLNLNATFNGVGHIGVLRGDMRTGDVNMLMDENYIGLFSLTKQIALEDLYKNQTLDEGWLPCCSSGWADMAYWDKKSHGESANRIFNCTCYKD